MALNNVFSQVLGKASLFRMAAQSHRCLATSINNKCAASASEPSDEVLLEYLDGEHQGVAVMSINRPKARNSLSMTLVKRFTEHMATLTMDRNVRVIVLKSAIPRIFCAGADLKERAKMTEADVPLFVSRARMLFQQFSELPVPTICALDGAALGGGLELALACDFRIASTSALLGLPETKLAIIPGAGGTVRLPRLIGEEKAKELIFTGKVMGSEEAKEYGVVSYSVDQNEEQDAAYRRALELAEEILPQGPVALKMAKKSISKGITVDIYSALAIEEACYAQVVPTKDRIEGLTAFKEKRKPNYTGE